MLCPSFRDPVPTKDTQKPPLPPSEVDDCIHFANLSDDLHTFQTTFTYLSDDFKHKKNCYQKKNYHHKKCAMF